MKKMSLITTGLVVAAMGGGAYLMMNKKTKKKAGKLLDTALEDATSYLTQKN